MPRYANEATQILYFVKTYLSMRNNVDGTVKMLRFPLLIHPDYSCFRDDVVVSYLASGFRSHFNMISALLASTYK